MEIERVARTHGDREGGLNTRVRKPKRNRN
jgi:hypothetical protein